MKIKTLITPLAALAFLASCGNGRASEPGPTIDPSKEVEYQTAYDFASEHFKDLETKKKTTKIIIETQAYADDKTSSAELNAFIKKYYGTELDKNLHFKKEYTDAALMIEEPACPPQYLANLYTKAHAKFYINGSELSFLLTSVDSTGQYIDSCTSVIDEYAVLDANGYMKDYKVHYSSYNLASGSRFDLVINEEYKY